MVERLFKFGDRVRVDTEGPDRNNMYLMDHSHMGATVIRVNTIIGEPSIAVKWDDGREQFGSLYAARFQMEQGPW